MAALVPPVPDERSLLLGFLDQQRYAVRVTTFGLTDEQARSAPSASTLSVAGIVKHLTQVERNWMDIVLERPRQDPQAYVESFSPRPEETLEVLLDRYAEAAAATSEVVAGIDDLGRPVPVPRGVPWFPADVEAWSVRWVLQHLVTETARHAGHADIVRETVDGATGFALLAAAEGWPATPWLTPWTPAS